jgi:hypothetical protein
MPLDSKMPCLCCDKIVLVDSGKWGSMEMPVVVCPQCAVTVPQATVRVLFIMRSQIATMKNDMILVKRDVKRLFTAQQDLEQAMVQET